MNKKRVFEILYVVLILSVIIFLIWMVMFLKGHARECLANPVKYFEDKNEGASCTCIKDGKFYQFRPQEETEIYLNPSDLKP